MEPAEHSSIFQALSNQIVNWNENRDLHFSTSDFISYDEEMLMQRSSFTNPITTKPITTIASGSQTLSILESVRTFERQYMYSDGSSPTFVLPDDGEKDDGSVMYDNLDFTNLPEDFEVRVNDKFMRKDLLTTAMQIIAIKHYFSYKTRRSSQSRFEIYCINEDCRWEMNASVSSISKIWFVKSYINDHTCSGRNTQERNRQMTSSLIRKLVKQDLAGCLGDRLTPKGVAEIMQSRYRVKVSYFQAWLGRTKALANIRGSFEKSYSHLPSVGKMICEKNPGSYTETKLDSEGNFKYFFLAIAASIHGRKNCRPVISVDGTHLKGKYHGTLLLAAGHDEDNHIFPLAFGIVGSEKYKSWSWFMKNIRKVFGVREDLVIISDRAPAIPKAVKRVFPEAKYAVCMQHLWANVKCKYGKSSIQQMYYNCAKAYTHKEFHYWLDQLSSKKSSIKKYLLEAGPDFWARSHFPGKRYGLMTTNISESLNSVIKEARGWPVSALVLSWRCLLQRWFNKQRALIPKMVNGITAHSESVLVEAESKARRMNVEAINDNLFEVIDGTVHNVVNIALKTCSCCVWQLDDVPCSHAAATLYRMNLRPIDFVPAYFTKDAFMAMYSHDVNPVTHDGAWDLSTDADVINPPVQKRQPGRPKMKRFRSKSELHHPYHNRCGRCGKPGHNKRSCLS